MRRFVALLLLIAFASSICFADRIEYEYEPYEEEEFPVWAYELRRAESLFFGSFVLTYPLAMGIYSIASASGQEIPHGAERALHQAGLAACISLLIAGADWVIGRVRN